MIKKAWNIIIIIAFAISESLARGSIHKTILLFCTVLLEFQ